MWEKVKSIQFVKEGNEGLFAVMIPEHSWSIRNGLKMLDFLYEQDKKYNEFLPETKNMRPISEELNFSFIIGMSAYIVTMCAVERIIKRSYENLEKFIDGIGYIELLLSATEKDNFLKDRKEEIKDFKFWRDKVFAHTAYANPWEEDNKGTQETSVVYFGGLMWGQGGRDNLFELGGGGTVKNGEYPCKFPIISITRDYNKIKNHFQKWEDVFADILDKIKLKGETEIIKKNKNIKKVYF